MKKESRSDNQGGFSSVQNPMHYSAEAEEAPRNFADKAFLKLTRRNHMSNARIEATNNKIKLIPNDMPEEP